MDFMRFNPSFCQQSILQVSLNGVRSLREMQTRISNFAQERAIAPGAWVTAWDFDPADMENGKTLSLADLDTLAPQHKLVIRHKSGHMGWFNSAALEALGVKSDLPQRLGVSLVCEGEGVQVDVLVLAGDVGRRHGGAHPALELFRHSPFFRFAVSFFFRQTRRFNLIGVLFEPLFLARRAFNPRANELAI